ncbi:squalene synthase, partial [Sistotremastrum suecicum HHB10207 ss-3]
MGAKQYFILFFTHPNEFRNLVNYWLWHDARDITAKKEIANSGWDRESMRTCWKFLDLTSRSFAAVIKELDGDLARTICMFYLALRGLDTIEDDMTLSDEVKQPLLRTFYQKLVEPGWTFDGSGPNEKDRQLLVEYDAVTAEMNLLKPEYRDIIVDISHKMGIGMADFAHRAAISDPSVPDYLTSVEEFDLYCHYVAGLVGEGLSRIFSASGKEAPFVAEQLTLSNSMGLLLQKTNILRDYREDVDERRYFWPKAIWGAYGFEKLEELYDPKREDEGLWALSGMTLDALRHATDALDYLVLLRNQTVFNFCAIPAVMALATLALCFMNRDVLHKNVKIRRGQAVKLIMASKNPRDVAYLFRDYARAIHAKATPRDPNFMKICVACGKIEQWAEHHYPSFVNISASSGETKTIALTDPSKDARVRIAQRNDVLEKEINLQKRFGGQAPPLGQVEKEPIPWELLLFVAGGVCVMFGLSGLFVWGAVRYF